MPLKVPDWFIFTLISIVLYGFWGFFPKLATGYIMPKSALFWEAVGSVVVGIVILVILDFKPEMNFRGAFFAFMTGIFGLLGTLSFFYALGRGKASVIVTMTALYPVVVIFLSYLLLHESVTLKQGLGIVLALLAIGLFAG